jgi:hypothetical protein
MGRIFLFQFLLWVPFLCEATDRKPWFGKAYEAEIRADLLYQNYREISIPHKVNIKRNENDEFMTLSAAYPFMRYCGEFEATAANTRRQHFRWDNFRFTGRYQWLNEGDGSAFSLVTGITLTQPFSKALHDISSFHHGHIEGEFDLSIGKNYGYCEDTYHSFCWWNVIGIGTSDIGSPWVRGDAGCEYSYEDAHRLRGFINTLWGLGKNNLKHHHFKGYGSIRHKSVDLGIRYGYSLGCWGTLSFEYARRVYASNFPENVNLVLLEYYFPFGNQPFTTY